MNSSNRPLALVTGASRGIGAELARELAKDGHDLVLVARSLAPMQALAGELRRHGAGVTILHADLSAPDAAAALSAEIEARELTVEVLVNNAGLGALGRFADSDPRRVSEMLNVNIVALTELTRLLLPGMIARGRGRIMLVGSIAGFQPGPHMAVYFASKAFVVSFGEALAWELRSTGVTVTTVCPGGTATEFFTVAGGGAPLTARPMMSATTVARQGYRALKGGRRLAVTGWRNRIFALGGRFAPRTLLLPLTNLLMGGD